METENTAEKIIARCGLICSDCGMFKKQKCQGCHCDKPMSLNCKVKPCANEHCYSTCAECADFDDLKDCKKLNNLISKIFALIFRSDRIGNLNKIKELGLDEFKAQN